MLKLSILSPERRILNQAEAMELTLPTAEGQIQILPGHAAMVGVLHTGVLEVQLKGQGSKIAFLSTGFFQVHDDEVMIMAETLELPGEIDLERAKRAQLKAEQELVRAELSEQSFKKYQLKLQRSLIRQQLAGRTGTHA